MTELTAEKIRLTMLAIQADRLAGRIGETEPVSTGRMARYSAMLGCPVSEITFRRATDLQLSIIRRVVADHLAANNPEPE